MNKVRYIVSGMTCHNCEDTIISNLMKIRGVEKVDASFKTGEVFVIYSGLPNPKKVEKVINNLGYQYRGIDSNNRASLKDIIPIILLLISIYVFIGSIFGFDFLSRIPTVASGTPLMTLFVIGLLTSIHCIGMCGSINLIASVNNDGSKSFKRPLLYNLGRITSYTLIGALLGFLGSIFKVSDFFNGLLISITAIVMLMMGLSMLGWLPKKLFIFVPHFKSRIKISNNSTPFVIGFLNGFMPCGPLQAMQLYALSTGSFILGGLSLLLFSLGTVPLVFSFGFLMNKLQSKYQLFIKQISSSLIILLALFMMFRGFNYLGFDMKNLINKITPINYDLYSVAEIKDGYQYVEINLAYTSYKPVIVEKGIPVKFNIKATSVNRYGCTNQIIIPSLYKEIKLVEGDNIIEFTPNKVGYIDYTCSMRMVSGHILVVDSIENLRK